MPEIFHVAIMLICFHGNCTSFESVPFIQETSQEQCQNMLRWTFETQAGPYYDEKIDFEKDKPEDIDIVYAGCDQTGRTPDNSNQWRIIENINPDLYRPSNPDDTRWQQGNSPLTDMPPEDPTKWDLTK
tara:strand:+ start:1436 stop:1822 length:387 start_codon:yes stop_codon:yes gene_type:complete